MSEEQRKMRRVFLELNEIYQGGFIFEPQILLQALENKESSELELRDALTQDIRWISEHEIDVRSSLDRKLKELDD